MMVRYAVVALLCVSLMWGAAFPIQKAALDQAPALWVATLRAVLAALVMVPFVFRGSPLGRRGHVAACWIGICNVSLFFGLQAFGLLHVSPGVAAGVIFTQPVLIQIIGVVVLRERLTRRGVTSGVLVLVGVVLLGSDGTADAKVVGLVVLLGAALAWAMGTLGLRGHRDLPSAPLVAASTAYGAAPLLFLSLALGQQSMPTSTVWWAVAYLGVFATASAWWILAIVLRSWSAWRVSALLATTPALAALLSASWGLGELTSSKLAGIAVISIATICGVWKRDLGRIDELAELEPHRQQE